MAKFKYTKEEYKSAWASPFGIALLVYYFTMAIIGMFVPDDILSNHVWARNFSDFIASIVPQIDRITALNVKPDVNRFYFSVLWTTSPVLISLVLLAAMVGGINKAYVKRSDSITRATIGALAGVLLCLYAISLSYIDPKMKLSLFFFANKIGMSFFGQIIFVNGPILLLTGLGVLAPYFLLSGKYAKVLKAVNEQQDGK